MSFKLTCLIKKKKQAKQPVKMKEYLKYVVNYFSNVDKFIINK